MNKEELVKKAKGLPIAERKAVVKEVSLSIFEELDTDAVARQTEILNAEFDAQVISDLFEQRISEMTPERQVLSLSMRGYSAPEIAKHLGISVSTVKMRLHTIFTELTEKSRENRPERLAAFHRLRGMLKTDGPAPTDQELKEDYISFLAEKYS